MWTLKKITCCTQEKDESVSNYYYRLFETFGKHSGLTEPTDRGNKPSTWESLLLGYFLKGLKPEISRGAKASYVEWKNGRLTSALMHAIHAEDQLHEKKDRKPLTMAVVQHEPNKAPTQQKERGRNAGSKWLCYLCATNEHMTRNCTKCRVCRRDGHWSNACPNVMSD